jgi:para-aminobenzoate synthetase
VQTLIVDNYDSYTFNLYQMLAEVNGVLPIVIRNNELDWDALSQLKFDNVVISPGPGRPEKAKDFGICGQILQNLKIPLLGVCLGHQGLSYFFGGKVIYAPEVMHGRLSKIYHNGSELFQGIPSHFSVVRYHSLLVSNELPSCLEKVAWTEEGLVMALRHQYLPFWGVQFHPESICTQYGRNLLENFRAITLRFAQKQSVSRKESQSTSSQIFSLVPLQGKPQQHQQEFVVVSKKLDIYPDTEQVFFHLFGTETNAFWLDSSRVEEGLSRFSFMGDSNGQNSLLVRYCTQTQEVSVTQSGKVTHHTESIFEYLKRELAYRYCRSDELPFDFNCGFVGYFGYELKAECDSQLVHSSSLPDAVFILADRIIAFDHQERTTYLLYLTPLFQTREAQDWMELIEQQLRALPPLPPIEIEGSQSPIIFRWSRSYQTYINNIQQCLHYIHEGETYQVCLTNKLYTDTTPNPLTFYRILRQINPAPYSAFLSFDEFAVACSSPERFLQIDSFGWVETKPIKGTLTRGQTPEEDFLLYERLRNSEKDRAENLMIVDLLRNDLGRACVVGSIHVPKLMSVETYATLHQLVTTIRGCLRPDMGAIDCIRIAFPGGSMTGAPKIRTMEIIDSLEREPRGIYSGSIGFLALNGAADLNIVIRTAVLTPHETSIGVGGGIVALSDPEAEFEEILLKAKPLVHAMLLSIHGQVKKIN